MYTEVSGIEIPLCMFGIEVFRIEVPLCIILYFVPEVSGIEVLLIGVGTGVALGACAPSPIFGSLIQILFQCPPPPPI